MKVLVLILNPWDKQTKEGDFKGHPIEVPVGLCLGQKWAWQNGNVNALAIYHKGALYVFSGLLQNASNLK